MNPSSRTATAALATVLALGLTAIAGAVPLTTDSLAGPSGTKQRVAITMKGLPNGTFVLAPLQTGALKRDSGTADLSYRDPPVVLREGQRVEIYVATITFTGKRGTLVIRERFDVVDTGDALIGTGTWRLLRGTRDYAGIAGGGRTAHVGHNGGTGNWFAREEGFLTLP